MGHGAGTKSSFQKNSNQPSASVKRAEETQQASVANPDGGTSVGKAPASLAEFREDEDGVIMGDPGFTGMNGDVREGAVGTFWPRCLWTRALQRSECKRFLGRIPIDADQKK